MSARVVHLESTAHGRAFELLPWYALGSLDETESEAVRQHVEGCPVCRRELGWLREFEDLYRGMDAAQPGEDALARLHGKIEARAGVRARWRARIAAWRARLHLPKPGWIPVALGGQLAVMVALSTALLVREVPTASFHTLGAAPDAVAETSLVVVFDPRLPEQELRRALRDAGAQMKAGPTQSNAYVLAVPRERREQALESLRHARGVVLAEALDAGAPQ